MWPSRETAAFVYDIANWGLIAGLVVGAISTVLIVWMGNVKEGYLRGDLGDSNARAESAKSEAAKANERTGRLELVERFLNNIAVAYVSGALSSLYFQRKMTGDSLISSRY